MRQKTFLKLAWQDPVQVLSGLTGDAMVVALLSDGTSDRGRWSYIGAEPSAVMIVAEADQNDPFSALDDFIGPLVSLGPTSMGGIGEADLPPFQGGVMGLAAYELGARAEPVALARAVGWPDIICGRYDSLLAFDHHAQTLWAVGSSGDLQAAAKAAAKAKAWLARPQKPALDQVLAACLTPVMSAEQYEAAVASVIAKIAAGEIFQANIARGWTGTLSPSAHPIDLVYRLAKQSPAPFSGYMGWPGQALVSNSPERFIQIIPGSPRRVQTRPIKGTTPRDADQAADRALAEALSQSTKDRAENLMIVDLMRNDLSRVCRPGSVQVPELFRVESFVNVHHLVSTVEGELLPHIGAGQVLGATYPPGSISGAPKVQAMQVIAGLEPARGPYCGSLFWAGYDGGFDSSVLIRTTAFVQGPDGWRFHTQAGAGIVADSQPISERLETETKISAIAMALTGEPT